MLVAQLTKKLVTQLNWNVARLNCLSTLIISVLNNHTVNLVILATEASGDTKCESLYRRFQNFFLKFNMPLDDIGKLVISKLPKPKEGWVLSMDRTNWKYGRTHINILVVGIVINKVAFPIIWMVLPQPTKRGNSNTNDPHKGNETSSRNHSGERHQGFGNGPRVLRQKRRCLRAVKKGKAFFV